MASLNKKVQIPGKTAQELYAKVSTDIDRFLEKSGVSKYEILRDDAKKRVTIKSSMVNATLDCTDGCMTLDGKLSLLATPFKSKIEEGIAKWVMKAFQIQV